MKTLFHFPITTDVVVRLTNNDVREIPVECKARVDEIWEKEKREGFFDGTVLCLRKYSEEELLCDLVSFKTFYASIRDKSLKKMLHIFPIGISGRTLCNNKILLGTRSETVAFYRGEKECVPSGSIDRLFVDGNKIVNLECGISTELSEESGIDASHVKKIIPRSLYWDREGCVWDIHLDVYLKDDVELDNLVSAQGEYTHFQWVDRQNISVSLLEECLPLSRLLLQLPF